MNIFKKVTVGALIVAFAFLGAVGVSEAASKISQSEARDIAEDYYRGNGELTEIVLENEDGDLVYEVEFTESDGNEVDIIIDAYSGDVVGTEDDRTDGDDDDEDDGNEDEEDDDELVLYSHKGLSPAVIEILQLLKLLGLLN
jgi:hypothetical protein